MVVFLLDLVSQPIRMGDEFMYIDGSQCQGAARNMVIVIL